MSMQKALDNLLLVLIGGLGYGVAITAHKMPEGFFGDIGAGAFPSFLGYSLLLATVIGLIRNSIKPCSKLNFNRAQLHAWVLMLLLITLFVMTWHLTGEFLLSLTGFLFSAFSAYRPDRSSKSLALNLAVTLCLTAGAYWLFILTLGVQFE